MNKSNQVLSNEIISYYLKQALKHTLLTIFGHQLVVDVSNTLLWSVDAAKQAFHLLYFHVGSHLYHDIKNQFDVQRASIDILRESL